MTMNYLQKKSEKANAKQQTHPPEWVSKENVTYDAWKYVEQRKKEITQYIKQHSKVTDFLTQKTYKIKGSEIAKGLKINRPSLMCTSSFSATFSEYLDEVNTDLEAAKDEKLEKAKKKSSRCSVKESKDDLVLANKKLKERVDELEAQKMEELVARTFDELPLPVKKKLGIS